ncbi:MAG: glycosyltransferase family 39 protein [Nanoarchaeota archaeon]|nr:glycosyltransferase family 39 protein [Nanoarchaeota archaeon]
MRKNKLAYLAFLPLVGIVYALTFFKLSISEDTLFYAMPAAQLITLAGILFFFVLCFRTMSSYIKLRTDTVILLLIIFALGLFLRTVIPPQVHRILYDEDIYLNIGQTISTNGKACLCDFGTPDNCIYCIDNKEPSGWPSLLSVFFKLFGAKEQIAFTLSILLNSFSVILVFLIAYLLYHKESIALYSALVLSLLRTHIEWSSTVSADAVSMFFNCLAILALLIYLRKQNWKTLGFFIFSVVYASQIRPESFLIFMLAGILLLLHARKIYTELFTPRLLIFLVILLLLIFPNVMHLKNASNEDWGAGEKENGEKFGTKYIAYNLKTNLSYFVENNRFSLIFTILALVGLALSLRYYLGNTAFMLSWELLYFTIFILFYAGSFNYGMDVRFAINLFPPVSIFCGVSLAKLESMISSFRSSRKAYITVAIKLIIIVTIALLVLPQLKEMPKREISAYDSMLSHDFAIQQVNTLPKDSMFITHVPSMILINGGNAFQANLYHKNEFVKQIFSNYTHVYWYEGFWCMHDPHQRDNICSYLKKNYVLYPVASITNEVNPNRYNYTLYRIFEK